MIIVGQISLVDASMLLVITFSFKSWGNSLDQFHWLNRYAFVSVDNLLYIQTCISLNFGARIKKSSVQYVSQFKQ